MVATKRNDPCPCGSGKKFKKCCLGLVPAASTSPASTTDHLMKMALEHQHHGRMTEAITACREVLTTLPEHPEALHLLGLIAGQAGQYQTAIDLIGHAIRIDASNAEYYNDMGRACSAISGHDQAVACYQRALAIQPEFSDAHNNLGCAYFTQGKLEDAVASYRRALALRPDYAPAHHNLGMAYAALGRLDEAVASYGSALALKPDYFNAHMCRANALMDRGKPEDAEASYKKAIALNPGIAVAHFNLGFAQFIQGKLDEAMACYQKALELEPDYINPHINLGVVYLNQGRHDDARVCLRKALEIKPDSALAYSTLLVAMLYVNTPPDELHAEQQAFSRHCEQPPKSAWRPHRNSRKPERRLKVGYVSPDFRRHSVAHFIEPILAHHDKALVDVHCYYNHTIHDEITDRIAACTDHWIPCKAMSDEQLAERIRADGIDILVDLAGHTINNRLLVFARKPAPVQLTYLGYPATTGLEAMDYRLVTADTDPPGAEAFHSERLYHLPRTLWCYRPDAARPEGEACPPGRKAGYITFGSMNAYTKISTGTLAAWTGILRAVHGSRLMMTSVPEGSIRQSLRDRFAAQGIEPHRLTLLGKVPADQYLDILRQIDIALDPFPYNGTTTTCETLWMGIPVVALLGRTSVSRSGYALLKAVGLEELVAKDEQGYAAIALRLAGDLEYLAGLRAGLRQRMMASPLRDEAGLARNLEACYRGIWNAWCESPASSPGHPEPQSP